MSIDPSQSSEFFDPGNTRQFGHSVAMGGPRDNGNSLVGSFDKSQPISRSVHNPNNLPVMNNKRLEKFSEKLRSDKGDSLEKRVFFLFAGTDLNQSNAFSLELALNKYDDPKKSMHVNVDINIDNLTVEKCTDTIISLTQLVPDYRIVFLYDDMFPKPSGLDLEKMTRYQAPLYYLKTQLVKGKCTEAAVDKYISHLLEQKVEKELGFLNTTDGQRKKQQKEVQALEETQLAMQKLDQTMKTVNFKVNFNLEKISIEITGNKSDHIGNSKLVSFGLQKQQFSINKEGADLNLNMFGVTLGSYNKFEEIYKIAMRTKNTMTHIGENVANQLNKDTYIQEL